MATEKRLIDYYVVRNKNTGFYFRGKGANRWGEYHNQASIYRIRANAENTANWLNLRGEPVEIVPIRIIENPTVDAVEVVRCKDCTSYCSFEISKMYGKMQYCSLTGLPTDPCDFCSYGGRRKNA